MVKKTKMINGELHIFDWVGGKLTHTTEKKERKQKKLFWMNEERF